MIALVTDSRKIILIVHNVRSAQNVGSILRSADAFGLSKIYLTGFTPYPLQAKDDRLPHIAAKVHARIAKTALGAENTVAWQYEPDIDKVLAKLKASGFLLAGLEQSAKAITLPGYSLEVDLAVVVGREVEGIEPEVIKQMDLILEIPMLGQKESLNVAVAAGIAMYQLRFSEHR
jgi:23S rRNA (guanosine2251-2'-O)-methyltransferase